MADVDTSAYPKAQNPLDTLSGFARLQNVLNQNKLFQQEYNSKLGLSQLYKDVFDPNTGQMDPSKIPAALAGPNGANVTLGLPEAYRQSQEAQQRNISIDTAKLDNVRQHLNATAAYLAPLTAPGANPTSSDVVEKLAHAQSLGLLTPQKAAEVYSTLPRDSSGQIDESKIPAAIRQFEAQVMQQKDALDAFYPPPVVNQNPGGSQTPMRFPQFGTPSAAGPTIQAAPSPTQQYVDQHGKPHYFGNVQGGNPYADEYARRAGGVPSPQSPVAPGGNIAGVPAGLSPSESAALQGQGQASIEQASALQKRADAVPTNKASLANLDSLLSQFTPGPGAKWSNQALAAGNRVLQSFGLKGVGADSVAAQEEFTKQALQVAQVQFNALGGTGANAQLESVTHTSPNESLSKLGNKGIISLLQGNEDAIQAKNAAWQKYQAQNGPQSYGAFQTEFNQHFDPRVFQFQYLNREEQKKLIYGMSQSEKNRLHDDAVYAREQGLIGG